MRERARPCKREGKEPSQRRCQGRARLCAGLAGGGARRETACVARIYLYADESGNFDFSQQEGATRYFVLTTVAFFDDRRALADLGALREAVSRELATPLTLFHASEDRQAVRDRVFEALRSHRFRVDATILEKPKAHPQVRETADGFYFFAWSRHLRIVHAVSRPGDEILITAAALGGTPRKERSFRRALSAAVDRFSEGRSLQAVHQPSEHDPGLQVADYCSWAIFRKWERDDDRSYRLIQDKIRSELDTFGTDA